MVQLSDADKARLVESNNRKQAKNANGTADSRDVTTATIDEVRIRKVANSESRRIFMGDITFSPRMTKE